MQKNIQNIYEQVKKVADYAEKINAENERLESSNNKNNLVEYKKKAREEYKKITLEAQNAIKNQEGPLLRAIVPSCSVSGMNLKDELILLREQMNHMNFGVLHQKNVAAIQIVNDCSDAVMPWPLYSEQKYGLMAINLRDNWDSICGYNIKLIGNV